MTKLTWLVGFALVVSLLYFGFLQTQNAASSALSYSIEHPLEQVSLDEVDDALYPFLVQGFWEVDLLGVQAALENLVWVKSAEIQRSWPSNLKVKIQEYQPIARWGQASLVSAEGVVFTPKSLEGFEHLIQLEGDLLQVEGILQLLNGLREQLSVMNWQLADMRQHIDGVLTIQLDNGLTLIVEQANWSAKLQRFIRAYPLLDAKWIESAQGFDLRNTNGFAIMLPKATDAIKN